jgi:hypothetical protein
MLCESLKITPLLGEMSGDCCICGKHTDSGYDKKFSGNFTSAPFLSPGEVICPECYYVKKHSNQLRRTMFLLTEDDFIKFKKKEARKIVFNLPNKPFYIYLTKTWQKIGWVKMNDAYNTGNDNIINFLVDYDIIRTDLETLKKTCDFIGKLRELKIPKNVLENGRLEVYHFSKLVEEYGMNEARQVNNKICMASNNPIWDLALFLED